MLNAGDTGGVLLDEFFANFTESECAGASIAANFTKGMNHLSYYKLRTNVKGFTQLITAFEQSNNYQSFSKSIWKPILKAPFVLLNVAGPWINWSDNWYINMNSSFSKFIFIY